MLKHIQAHQTLNLKELKANYGRLGTSRHTGHSTLQEFESKIGTHSKNAVSHYKAGVHSALNKMGEKNQQCVKNQF